MAKLINLRPFKEFLQSGSAGGIILIICVIVSLIIANTGAGPELEALLASELGYHFGNIHLKYSLLIWINDGLMAIFFLMVGLEIKRELVEGELSSLKKAALPIFAALGGVIVPAVIFSIFNKNTPTAGGWGIPMATDIAFAIAIITMLGKKVPASLKIFLAALAIVDDLMAILVIAVFYSSDLHYTYLLYAGGIFGVLLIFNKLGVKNLAAYLIPGLFIWYFIHHSGVHATIAGVLTAFAIPTTPDATESPLEKLEHILMTPVNFVIMPVFALANTNIALESSMIQGLTTPLGLGIILGLVVGKPVGITALSWLSVKLGISARPHGAGWLHIIGVGMLGGIGFTMSVFIALLSFAGQDMILSEAKFSILTGSILSGLMGYAMLTWVSKKSAK
ncbi:Na+/H+ antiporter NhaA [Dyadobacter fanqingshengii]|uniref:Na(+)/H(+) antiporter NhaA n=1 Tax=Dyadobacter fanqingshengii TaxID=2906443 RepID=A0A9X1PDJ9_9BACT|nr:Na+/H+ antiporter NhaA [Dyadobacter fanqingshengii]MCF0043016.1 Na+/H+ antiporter NhaA [Dyadobacter fanqingshengii]USJ35570.1 Na+/H+ antiporter NhaA [Dyadobacter fanqingshengii]